MNDLDTHAEFERLMTDEPAHRSLPDLVRAGERRLRRRRLARGGAALAVVAVAGAGLTQALPDSPQHTARDESNVADHPSSNLISQSDLTGPQGPSAYSYVAGQGCGTVGDWTTCQRYQFKVAGVRDSVVAAVEYRLIDGNSMKVAAVDGEYHLKMTGRIPAGDRFDAEEGLVNADGGSVDLFAGLTLFAADGSVLATATSTDSTQLAPYPELCDLLRKDEDCARP